MLFPFSFFPFLCSKAPPRANPSVLSSLPFIPANQPRLLAHPAGFPSSSHTPNSGPGCHSLKIQDVCFQEIQTSLSTSTSPGRPGNQQPFARRGQVWLPMAQGLQCRNVQPGGGRGRGAGMQPPGSAVTLGSAQQKPARKGL